MARYLSGRSKKRPQSKLKDDRNKYLSVDQAEPNLGDPTEFDVEGDLPPGPQYQIVSVLGDLGERYWIPRGGGLIPGSITVFDESVIIPNNSGVSSITQLDFRGDAVEVTGYLNGDGSPGVGVTITIFSPGSQGQVIFNNNNDFKGASNLFYDNSTNYIGVGTSTPTQELHVNGDIRLTGTIYDQNNQPGNFEELLLKNDSGGLTWVGLDQIITGAGGTITNIQYHDEFGLLNGAANFVFDYTNSRVGIGSTLPKYLLDVLGYSRFKGQTEIDYLNVGLSTIENANISSLHVSGFSTFSQLIDANNGATIDNIRIGVANNNEIDTSSGDLILDSSNDKVIVDANLDVNGVTSVGLITGTNGYFTGIVTANILNIIDTNILNLNVTGIATISNANIAIGTCAELDVTSYLDVIGNANFQQQVDINNLTVTGIAAIDNVVINGNTIGSSSGNLILDSNGNVESKDKIIIDETTESTSSSTGSLTVKGGVGILKNTNIGGNFIVDGKVTLANNGGITTTGGDFYVGGDLYVNDDLVLDDISANTGNFKESLTTKDFNATGQSTISILTVSGTATFNGNVDLGNATSDTVTFVSKVDSNIIPSGTRNLGNSTDRWNTIYANTFDGVVTGTITKAQNLAGGTQGDIPYQIAEDTTTFLADPGSSGDGYLLYWDNSNKKPAWQNPVNNNLLDDVVSDAEAAATAAANSATAAGTSATNAANSATAAGTSATAAGTSATNAADDATAAGTSATAAGTSATNAANSATAAGTSATNAANSATAAGTSATAAGTSATNAADDASTIQTIYDNLLDGSSTNQVIYKTLTGFGGDPDFTFSTDTATVTYIKPTGIKDSSNGTGSNNQVLIANGSGGWTWAAVWASININSLPTLP